MSSGGGPGLGVRFTVPLLLGASLNPINSSIIATALVPIAGALHISAGRTTVLVTALYVASAISQPAMGRFGQAFGPRRMFLVGCTLVALGGVVGAVATDLVSLVVARVVLGVGTAAGFPTAMLMIRRRAEVVGAAPGGTLGALVIASQVTVLLGLPLGGLLVTLAGWRATFWINVPLAALVLLTAWRWSPPDEPRPGLPTVRAAAARLDLPGLVLFACVLTSLVTFLVRLPEVNTALIVATLACTVALLWWEARAGHPILDVHGMVENLPLTGTYARASGTMLTAYTTMYGLTQWLQETRGLAATTAGLLIVPMSAAGALITRPVARRGLIRIPLLAGAVLALAAGVAMRFTDRGTPLVLIVGLTTLVGAAMGLATFGNQSAVLAQADPEEVGTASGLLRTSGYIGAIASGSLVGVVFRDGATDAGLQAIADVLIAVCLGVLVLTAAARHLPGALVLRRAP